MEKYGQYRDKGSGVAPFFPIAPPPSNIALAPYHLFLYFLRVPFLLFAWAVWFLIVQWTPYGVIRKANLWCLLGIPGVWFIDIRVDGVQRGGLGKPGAADRLPGPGSIIAASFTSPVDVLYLAAIFDPIFTQSFPGTRKVKSLTLEGALAACFSLPGSPDGAVELSELVGKNPGSVIVVFPETTTSNGRGVLRLSPSLLSATKTTNIYPLAIRYTPSDVVTPIPGWIEVLRFSWKLMSRQTHCIRCRIGLPLTLRQHPPAAEATNGEARGRSPRNKYDTNFFDSFSAEGVSNSDAARLAEPTRAEQHVLDLVVESLSRLARSKTLGLGIEEKKKFVDAWSGKSKKRR